MIHPAGEELASTPLAEAEKQKKPERHWRPGEKEKYTPGSGGRRSLVIDRVAPQAQCRSRGVIWRAERFGNVADHRQDSD